MSGVDDVLAHVHEEARQDAEEYRSGAPRPLVGYVAVPAVFAPRFTRTAATTLSVVAGADFLQLAYSALQSRTE